MEDVREVEEAISMGDPPPIGQSLDKKVSLYAIPDGVASHSLSPPPPPQRVSKQSRISTITAPVLHHRIATSNLVAEKTDPCETRLLYLTRGDGKGDKVVIDEEIGDKKCLKRGGGKESVAMVGVVAEAPGDKIKVPDVVERQSSSSLLLLRQQPSRRPPLVNLVSRDDPCPSSGCEGGTIRKRIKFIMGGDEEEGDKPTAGRGEERDEEEEEEEKRADQENCKMPATRKGNSASMRPKSSSSNGKAAAAPPEPTSKLRLRHPCSKWLDTDPEKGQQKLLKSPPPLSQKSMHHEKEEGEEKSLPNDTGSGNNGDGDLPTTTRRRKNKKASNHKTATTKTATTTTTRKASTSNRTRSRFFRFNKRTIRAVALLLVKLCGLLVASILIPSSKLVITAVADDSGLDEFEQSAEQFSATNNMDDNMLLLEYGVEGYGSSTGSPANVSRNMTVIKVEKDPLFPKDLFTEEQRRNGAVVFHIIGVMYMFVALAIVCDEFFVPSLDVIIEKMGITDDVAGATFMAAGGSAPELFTSVIGVFVSFDDVGIGTIVGSAVFNILFVIGMCALFSKTILSLTWWPLFRDCTFYSVSLLTLIWFFRDNKIYWWEALILFSIYAAYVSFMKWNVQMERCVKKFIYKNKVTRVRSTDQLMPAGNAANSSETSMATQPGGSVTSRAASESRSGPGGSSAAGSSGGNVTGAKFRHGLLQLMIHTIDPLHDDDVLGKVDEKATQLHAIASLKVLLDATKPQRGAASTSAANHVKINLRETNLTSDRPNGNIDTQLDNGNDDIEDEPEALNMSWPSTGKKRITYLLVAPILFPLWLTLPDTKTPRGKRFFYVTFIGSIVWIAAYSYLMVWWANVAGETAKIPPEVMGLTFLAAGTSIPDLITSVIVARKGFGDMAVSSSVGSNIFDVTVGLPIPWLLYGLINGAPVEVNSVGMVCSITILFIMLLFVVLSIACFRWRMNKGLGFTMFLLYFVFVAVSLMFEYDVLECPVQ